MIKFPSIEKFKSVIVSINEYRPSNKPLEFVGSVKLHGTNVGIIFEKDRIYPVARNSYIDEENPNYGFYEFFNNLSEVDLKYLKNSVIDSIDLEPGHTIAIFGEWCGKGIQKKIAISQLEKMWVIFAIRVGNEDQHYWLLPNEMKDIKLQEKRIFNIYDFQTWNISIDFDNPGQYIDELSSLTQSVEKECPVGKAFGVSGTGEGIVWRCVDPNYNGFRYIFKVKGEKHKNEKTKKIISIDPEALNSINEYVDFTVTENRLNQGMEYLKELGHPLESKSTGIFLKWVSEDILKECSDELKASNLEWKDVNKFIQKAARNWYLKKVNLL